LKISSVTNNIVIALLIVITIVPFFWVILFVYLAADDICRIGIEKTSQFLHSWYFNENGRYVNALFSVLPVYNIAIYRLVLGVLLGFFILYRFFKTFHYYFLQVNSKRQIINFVIISFMILVTQLPSLYEFF